VLCFVVQEFFFTKEMSLHFHYKKKVTSYRHQVETTTKKREDSAIKSETISKKNFKAQLQSDEILRE
jgi:hypothetical protein